MSDNILLPFVVWTWTSEFHSVRTVGNRAMQHLVVDSICSSASNTMDLTIPNIIERRCDTTKKMIS